jgi:hypothetical protein
MNIAANRGFNAQWMIEAKGLCVAGRDDYYKPQEITVHNFYRFEGVSNPDDMSILYLIETNDGTKGTLVDAYGPYADKQVSEFMSMVENIPKSEAEE